ncbi:hypothetical protein STUTZSP0542_40410 [Stutzerimonas marianensis]
MASVTCSVDSSLKAWVRILPALATKRSAWAGARPQAVRWQLSSLREPRRRGHKRRPAGSRFIGGPAGVRIASPYFHFAAARSPVRATVPDTFVAAAWKMLARVSLK